MKRLNIRTIHGDPAPGATMQEDENGEYVAYSDVVPLLTALQEIREMLHGAAEPDATQAKADDGMVAQWDVDALAMIQHIDTLSSAPSPADAAVSYWRKKANACADELGRRMLAENALAEAASVCHDCDVTPAGAHEAHCPEAAAQQATDADFYVGVIAALGALKPHFTHGSTVHDEIVNSVGKEQLYAHAEPEDVEWAGLDPEFYAAVQAAKKGGSHD